MTGWPDKQHEDVSRFINNDSTVDSLNLCVRYCNGIPTLDTTPLSSRFFRAIKKGHHPQIRLSFLKVSIAGGVDMSMKIQFADALTHTKLQEIETLEIDFTEYSPSADELVAEALEKSNLKITNLRWKFHVVSKKTAYHLSKCLVQTRESLKTLLIRSLQCYSQYHTITIGTALQELELSGLDIIPLVRNEDPTYCLQLCLMMSDMESLEHLTIYTCTFLDYQIVADTFFKVVLPKLKNLKSLTVKNFMREDPIKLQSFYERLNSSLASRQMAIETLNLDYSCNDLAPLMTMVPALKLCKSLELVLTFRPEDFDDYESLIDHPRRPAEVAALFDILRACSHLEKLSLNADGLMGTSDEVVQISRIVCNYRTLKELFLGDGDWYRNLDTEKDGIGFPSAIEEEAFFNVARSCHRLANFQFYDKDEKQHEIHNHKTLKQLALNHIRLDEILRGQIPSSMVPFIIEKHNMAVDLFGDEMNAEILFGLLQEKLHYDISKMSKEGEEDVEDIGLENLEPGSSPVVSSEGEVGETTFTAGGHEVTVQNAMIPWIGQILAGVVLLIAICTLKGNEKNFAYCVSSFYCIIDRALSVFRLKANSP